MARLPENPNTTKHLLDTTMPPVRGGDNVRGYLGMSGLAEACSRKVWLGFRRASTSTYTPRTMRIFERGDIEEARIVAALKNIGIECFRRDKDGNKIEITGAIGEEQEELVGFAGHAKGHPDGRCIGVIEAPKTEHLLEIKTMNDAGFKKLIKDGLRKVKPIYFGQVQRYMDKMGLTRTLHITVNKNDEDIYVERIRLDEEYAKELADRERDIIMSDAPPLREFSRTWHECKWCNHVGVCHDNVPPVVTCRSCAKVDMEMDGVWRCSMSGNALSYAEQMKACPSYTRSF